MTKNIIKLTSETQKVNFISKKFDIKQKELALPIKKNQIEIQKVFYLFCFDLIKVRKKFRNMLCTCTCIVFFYLWMFHNKKIKDEKTIISFFPFYNLIVRKDI